MSVRLVDTVTCMVMCSFLKPTVQINSVTVSGWQHKTPEKRCIIVNMARMDGFHNKIATNID